MNKFWVKKGDYFTFHTFIKEGRKPPEYIYLYYWERNARNRVRLQESG